MIYELVLVFSSIYFWSTPGVRVDGVNRDRQVIWFQHNSKYNLLSLLAVNRQIYEKKPACVLRSQLFLDMSDENDTNISTRYWAWKHTAPAFSIFT